MLPTPWVLIHTNAKISVLPERLCFYSASSCLFQLEKNNNNNNNNNNWMFGSIRLHQFPYSDCSCIYHWHCVDLTQSSLLKNDLSWIHSVRESQLVLQYIHTSQSPILLLVALSKLEECPPCPTTQSSWSCYLCSGIGSKTWPLSLQAGFLFVHITHPPPPICVFAYLCAPTSMTPWSFLPPTSSFSALLLCGNSLPWAPTASSPLSPSSLSLSLLTSPFRLLIRWAVTVVRMIKFQSGVALWPARSLPGAAQWWILVQANPPSPHLHREVQHVLFTLSVPSPSPPNRAWWEI